MAVAHVATLDRCSCPFEPKTTRQTLPLRLADAPSSSLQVVRRSSSPGALGSLSSPRKTTQSGSHLAVLSPMALVFSGSPAEVHLAASSVATSTSESRCILIKAVKQCEMLIHV